MKNLNKRKQISSFLPELNLRSGGGFNGGRMDVVMGKTGVGKTTFLINQAVHSLKNFRNVLYVTFEETREDISKRIDRNLLGKIEEKRDETWKYLTKETKKRIVIYNPLTIIFNANNLRQIIEDLKNYKNFIPDIILFDSLEKADTINFRNELSYEDRIIKIIKEIKQVIKEYNVSFLTTIQEQLDTIDNYDKEGKNNTENNNLNINYKKVAYMDKFLIMSQTKEEKWNMKATISLIKNRYENGPIKIPLNVNFSKGIITQK